MSCPINEKCSHDGTEYHYEGACWFITQKPLEKDHVDEKYCICKLDDNIRLYKTKGFMVQEMNDRFITKPCVVCKIPLLLPANVTTCIRCREAPENYEPINPTEFVRATVKLHRPNQQKS